MLKTFSANSLNLFLKSKSEFYNAYVLNLPSLYMENYTQSGKNLHALIAYKLKGFDVKKLESALTAKEKGYWKNICESEIFKLQLLDVESSFRVKINDFWLTGRFDAVFKNNDTVHIYDWKTGKIPKESDMQTLVYLFCASKLYKTKHIKLTYFSLDDKSQKTIEGKNFEHYKSQISEVVQDIIKYTG